MNVNGTILCTIALVDGRYRAKFQMRKRNWRLIIVGVVLLGTAGLFSRR
jgi:hypothetical protein